MNPLYSAPAWDRAFDLLPAQRVSPYGTGNDATGGFARVLQEQLASFARRPLFGESRYTSLWGAAGRSRSRRLDPMGWFGETDAARLTRQYLQDLEAQISASEAYTAQLREQQSALRARLQSDRRIG